MTRTLKYHKAKIKGVVSTIGDKEIIFLQNAKRAGISDKEALRLQKMMGFESRYVVSEDFVTTSDLCVNSARILLEEMRVPLDSIDGLLFVSQTPDYQTPATSISMQDRLGLKTNTVCYDINLGCSGFIYGLSSAFGLIEAGLQRVLLCVGDVASKIIDPSDQSIVPIMGDAGSCILIEAQHSESWFQLYSDGSGKDSLIMPNSGARQEQSYTGKKPTLRMNGADVFTFSIKQVPPMINKLCEDVGIEKSEIDYFILHQPNQYMVEQIGKRLKIPSQKLPSRTQSLFGNQNSASIPGTLNGLLSETVRCSQIKVCLAGFGVGLSWGAAILTLDNIFCPKPRKWCI